jgi:hypothetical protein
MQHQACDKAVEELKCSVCGKVARLTPKGIAKDCEHSDAPVVMELRGSMHGVGAMNKD